ncbi:Sensor histidine kinase RcsC [Alphaproteobacteria bacterium SO-S41]|nr:Sensor histidine kinase RcsC [Alphaproteobacteria bacterium SO-S41]
MVGLKPVLFSQFADMSALSKEDAVARLSALEARVALSERKAGMGSFRWSALEDMPNWSPGLYRILGYDPGKPPVKDALFKLAHPDDSEIFKTAFDSVMAAPGPFYLRYRVIREDGAERHLEISGDVETGENGEMIAVVGIVTDISGRVETEEQLRSAMDAFRVLTEEANDLICRLDPGMGILYCSPAITRMLGYDPSEVLGNTFLGIINDEDRPELLRAHRVLLVPGAAKTITTRMHHKDGNVLWVETICRSVGDPVTGRVHEIITVSRDVTTRKAAEAEINKARETAESANRTKSRFLATMSHELRTPLNAIIGFSDMLKSELFGPLGSRYQEYSELIHESGTLLLDLINDILDMSKIEAGKFELAMETFDASETVESCLRLMKGKADQSGLMLEVNLAPHAVVEADKRAVKQILLNLLSNAIKFTPRGGRITTVTKLQGDHITLTVADTGVGIPADDLPRLGRPFEQAKQDANLAKAGTGLGLALVRSLVQLHGGDLNIESQEGRGTTVTVTLPKPRLAVAA